MDILQYNDLNLAKVKKQFERTVQHLRAGDFRAADVKKMPNVGFYRAKLDDTNRLLFKIGQYEGRRYLLLLEIIHNHAYEKSRFLNGALIDETKLTAVNDEAALKTDELTAVTYVNPRRTTFHLLNKVLSFDDTQEEILHLPIPLILMGSAGSGKTALTLEKLKTFPGRVLYATLSPYLAENARNLYYAFDYENEQQEVEFLSFLEYLSVLEVPEGKEVTFQVFEQWIWRYRQSHKIKDAYKIFEEFKGVLTGSVIDKPHLSEADYRSLGIRQSIFPANERDTIYDLFTKYLDWLNTERIDRQPIYDTNLLAYQYLSRIEPQYDFVVIDEVQDLTNVQLMALLKSLRLPHQFLLCGDANQIVHPNFFSWSQVKTLFYKQDIRRNLFRILATNYRNTPEVTRIANQLLLVKNARFGSIDKESTYLVRSNNQQTGEITFLENTLRNQQELDRKTHHSTHFAVLVLRQEDKAHARRHFQTPLVFSVQEAKGLEYENVILFNVISGYEREFRELTVGVTPADLEHEMMTFGRAKDKSDKSLDEYKFYVNSLYVAITRAIKNLYIVESNNKHDLLKLLGLTDFQQKIDLKEQTSTKEEWQREARRLEMQGKQEQADLIRKQVLQIQTAPWEVTTRSGLTDLIQQALNPDQFNKKAKDRLFEYALFNGEHAYFDQLASLNYRPAERWKKEGQGLLRRLFQEYHTDNLKELMPKLQKYGPDFRNPMNLTPFLLAISHGSVQIADYLLKNGAQANLTDNYGRNALQLALLRAYLNEAFKSKVLNRFYGNLKADSLRIQINHRLVKIDSHQAEYLILQFMLAVLRTHLLNRTATYPRWDRSNESPTFQTADFMDFFEGLSEQVIPDYRRQRAYLSSILAKNELSRDDKYNKKLFIRLRMGHYVPNPLMQVQIGEEWVNIYDLVNLTDIQQNHARFQTFFLDQIQFARKQLTANPDKPVDFEILNRQKSEDWRKNFKNQDDE